MKQIQGSCFNTVFFFGTDSFQTSVFVFAGNCFLLLFLTLAEERKELMFK
jgi:hypothetical protein